MAETARLGALMIVHAEDGEAIGDCAHGTAYAGFLASRPDAAEERAIALVIDTARATGGRAHVVHLSASGAVPALRAARAAGVDVSVETCPHYLHFEAGEIPDGATEFKCCPPIRDAANRDALWAALADGDIDLVVTDHSPCTADLKRAGHAATSPRPGAGSPRCSSACRRCGPRRASAGTPLADVVGWMADRARPAGWAWPARARSRSGADADLCVFAPDEAFVVDAARLHHKNPVSAYAGRTLTGTVRQTWLRGVPVDLAAEPRAAGC